jgi:hypothetical protein
VQITPTRHFALAYFTYLIKPKNTPPQAVPVSPTVTSKQPLERNASNLPSQEIYTKTPQNMALSGVLAFCCRKFTADVLAGQNVCHRKRSAVLGDAESMQNPGDDAM